MGSLVDSVVIHYFETLDPNKTGKIQAYDAAKFLRTSGIQDNDLAVIWDLSDRNMSGSLDLNDFSVAVKLVALVQNGQPVNRDNLKLNLPRAKFVGYPSAEHETPDRVGTPPSRPSRPAIPDKNADSWVVSPQAKTQYDSIFMSLNPTNGKLSGLKVKPILMKSQLHVNVLGQIWELSDVDKDGQLDIEEFGLAMHLLNRAREGEAPPTTLPHNYIPPSHRVVYTKVQKVNWLVPQGTRKIAADEFSQVDVRGAGMLTGLELRPLLVRKGVQMAVLAKIWTLCDIGESGKLTADQYALALYLIDLHKDGAPIPEKLQMELIPPSFRTGPGRAVSYASSSTGSPRLPPRTGPMKTGTLPAKQNPLSANNPVFAVDKNATISFPRSTPTPPSGISFPPSQPVSSFSTSQPVASFPPVSSGNPATTSPALTSIPDELASLNLGSALDNADFSVIKELDTFTKETDSLTTEKAQLQSEIKSAEEHLSTAGNELKDLKKQLGKLEEEVEAARKQRAEIQSRVDEADAERRKYEELISDMHKKALNERQQISALQQQIASQDALRKCQEEELQKARDELSKLRQEESHYLHQVESGKRQLDTLIQNLRVIQSDTSLTQAKLVQIEAAHRTIDKALAELAPFGKRGPGLEGKPSILTNIHEVSQLRRQEPDVTVMSDITRATAGSSPVSSMSGFSVDSYMETHYENKNNEQLSTSSSNPFGPSADPFQADVDPFGGSDPFKTKPSVTSSKSGESESSGAIEENGHVQSGTNTPQMGRKHQASAESVTLRGDDEKSAFQSSADPFPNPFESSGDDPFKSSGFASDPFADPFQETGGDPFAETTAGDPFGGDLFKTVTNDVFSTDDPFASGNIPPEDPFATSAATSDPFGGPGPSATDDPFATKEMDDPFKETNMFTSENDAFNTHDPFANTPDPFAGSADIFKGSNNSLASKGTRGSKNSLNNFKNFGSKNSLQGSKNSLNESASVASESSPKLEPKVPEKAPIDAFASAGEEKSSDLFKTEDAADAFGGSASQAFTPAFDSDPFGSSNGQTSDPFGSSNGQTSDPFASSGNADPFVTADPFGSNADPFGASSSDPFTAKFDETDLFSGSGAADPFAGSEENSAFPGDTAFTATFS